MTSDSMERRRSNAGPGSMIPFLKKKVAPARAGKNAEMTYAMTFARAGSTPTTIATSWSSRIAMSERPNLERRTKYDVATDASVTSIRTRKSSSRRLGLFVTMGIAATSAMSTSSAGRNGARTLIMAGGFRSRARPKEPSRSQEQDGHEDDVLDHRHPGDRQEHGEDAFEQADDEAADERAGRVPETAEHDDDEALQLVGPAREDREAEERREQRTARHRERGADAEREREHAPRVDPHELRRGAVVRHRAD